MSPWLRYLIAFAVFCHGFIYVRIGSVLPGPIKAWKGTSWLLGSMLAGERLRVVAVILHVIAGVLTLACAAAIAFEPAFPGWWRPLAVAGSGVGIAGFVVFWDGEKRLLWEEGGIGAILSLILLGIAIGFPGLFG